jgi:acyl-coenzyme A thioesterase PaaI-like protein
MADLNWAGSDFQSRPSSPTGVTLCGACARLNQCRLGLGAEKLLPDGSVESRLLCARTNEGGPEVAHGGWTASIFDEVTGHVPMLNGVLSVTGRMTVNYLRPVPIERDLVSRAWPIERGERKWLVAAELRLDSTGALLGTAEAVMVLRDAAHFERHRRWLAEQDADAASPS